MPPDQSRRVLVVDDDPQVREILSSALRQRGVTVDVASDGREALEMLQAGNYPVILLDLFMPGIDGFGVLSHLRAQSNQRMPIVLVVTGADRAAIERMDATVIHGIIRKPFDPHDLAALVVACAEVRDRSTFETMAIAAVLAGTPLVALLSRFG